MMTSNKIAKRWAVIRAKTGTVVRSFASREAARDYKRYTPGNFKLFDTVNGVTVR